MIFDQRYLDGIKTRVIRNKHGSAKLAAEKWLSGSLWGSPIESGNNLHVYGLWNRDWTEVWVDFGETKIIVTRPPSPERITV